MVTDALHIRYHFQGSGDGSQIPGHRLLLNQQLEADVFDFLLLLVYQLVFRHNPAGGFRVLAQQGLHRVLDVLLNQIAHVGHFHTQLAQLFIKFCSHQPNLPVM